MQRPLKALRALWFYRSCFDEAANLIAVVGAAMKNKKIDDGEPDRIIAACEALAAAVRKVRDGNDNAPPAPTSPPVAALANMQIH